MNLKIAAVAELRRQTITAGVPKRAGITFKQLRCWRKYMSAPGAELDWATFWSNKIIPLEREKK